MKGFGGISVVRTYKNCNIKIADKTVNVEIAEDPTFGDWTAGYQLLRHFDHEIKYGSNKPLSMTPK